MPGPWSDGWSDGYGLGQGQHKHVVMHVSSEQGIPLAVWDDFIEPPSFSLPINAPISALEVRLPRSWAEAGEPGESTATTLIATDSFNRANNAATMGALDGSADAGVPWNARSGTWGINSNKAYISNTSPVVVENAGLVTVPLGPNIDASADFTLSASHNRTDTGILFRFIDNSNYLLMHFAQIASGNEFTLYKKVAGVFTSLKSFAPALTDGTTHTVRVSAVNNSIRGYLDGVLKIIYTLSTPESALFSGATASNVGFRIAVGAVNDDGNSRIDNFTASTPPVQDLALGNRVDIYIVDRQAATGRLIYSGSIQEYEFDLEKSMIIVTLLTKGSAVADLFFQGPVTFTAADPKTMMQYFVGLLPGIVWNAANPLVGQTYTQTFQNTKMGQILETIRNLAGGTWFFRFNPDDTFDFNSWNLIAPPTHNLIVDKHIGVQSSIVKSRLSRKRRVFVFGTFGVLAVNTATGYDPTQQVLDLQIVNTKIQDGATAGRLAAAYREFYDRDFVSSTIQVLDDNYPAQEFLGYDIESLRPGETIKVTNPKLGFYPRKIGDHKVGDGHTIGGSQVAQAQATLVISKIAYRTLSVDLSLQLAPTSVPDELVSVNERLNQQGTTG